jgi:small subunit ribosomal protein S1
MRIILAESAGFCGGVKKAVDAAQNAVKSGSIYSLGPLAHNEPLLKKLANSGVQTVSSLSEIPDGATVLIRTHGVGPLVYEEAKKKCLHIIDTTCPYVKKLQTLVAQLTAEGKQVIIAGDPHHPEVEGLVAWGQNKPLVVSSVDEVTVSKEHYPLALVFQTTQRSGIAAQIGEKLKEAVPSVEIYDTICEATVRRQQDAAQLAEMVDLMVVIGGKESANTKKLAELCRSCGVETVLVTEAGELDTNLLQKVKTVGVTAGASTPDWTIKEVIGKMEEMEKNQEVQAEQEEKLQEEQQESAQEDQQDQEQQASFEQEDIKEFSVGDVVKGVVVQINDDEILVNVGYKSEGVLPRQEMIVDSEQALSDLVETGQELELVVKKVDNREGTIVLSRKVLERKNRWLELEAAAENGTVLKGRVKEAVQAGVIVDLGGGYEGFMPGSLVDVRFIPDFTELVNTEIEFKIIELRREKEKVVVSRKMVLEEEVAGKKTETLNSLEAGQIIRGTVKRLTNFGAFVDVGGIDGLIHISEISWHRIENPSEVLNVGDEVDVKVIEVIPERERIGLSYRQAQPDPWTEISKKFKPGEVVEGKVTRLVTFGAFVELIPGVEGLVHISQMANYHVKQASEVAQEGQIVKVKILDINTEAKRVSLSMRDAAPRPKRESQPKVEATSTDTGTGLTLGDVFGDLFDREKDE